MTEGIDNLWLFAQIERGVETSLDRPAMVGSEATIERMMDEYPRKRILIGYR